MNRFNEKEKLKNSYFVENKCHDSLFIAIEEQSLQHNG
jgi:hypothetical protein